MVEEEIQLEKQTERSSEQPSSLEVVQYTLRSRLQKLDSARYRSGLE